MTPPKKPPSHDVWQRAEPVFSSLWDMSMAERKAALVQLEESDAALAEHVERLLEADQQADDEFLAARRYPTNFLSSTSAESVSTDAESEGEDATPGAPSLIAAGYSLAEGERVGDFEIERPLGQGGMGEVFLAHRVHGAGDEGFLQRVAIKVMRRTYGHGEEELRRRFLRERRILAQLAHPAIAALIDGGSLPDGRLFFAMEFVEGEAINNACANWPLRELLRIFLAVCEAVQFAHENLVVHRDLKPSNILVTLTKSNTTKSRESVSAAVSAAANLTGPSTGRSIKLLDFGIAGLLADASDEPQITRTQPAPATPEYAAPEQLRGDPVSTATDVFALGVVLFELLTGERPKDWPPRTEGAGRTPPRPAAGDGARLPADLVAITQRAIEEEPERRYRSVAELIADLERFGAGLPVHAQQGNRWYRIRRFVGRHRLGVASSLLLLIAIVAGLIGTLTQAQRALRNAARAERVVELLADVFEGNAPTRAQGKVISALDLLDEGAERISRDLEADPLVRAELETTLGGIYRSLGSYTQAQAQLDSAVAVLLERPKTPLLVSALYQRAELLMETGATERSRQDLEQAMRLPSFTRSPPELRADVLALLGSVRLELGEREEGIALLERAHSDRRGADLEAAVLARSSGQLADAYYETGDPQRATELYTEAVGQWASIVQPPDPRLAKAWSDLGVALFQQGKVSEAAPWLRDALEARRTVYGAHHVEVAHGLRNLSGVERALGNVAVGMQQLEEAVAIYGELFGDDHPEAAEAINNLAVALAQSGDLVGSAAMFERAVAAQRRVYGDRSASLILPLSSLGNLLSKIDRLEDAERHLSEAAGLAREFLEEGHPHRAVVAMNLGNLFLDTDRHERSAPLLSEALVGFQTAFGESHPNVGVAHLSLGRLTLATATSPVELEAAATHFRSAADVLTAGPPVFRPRIVIARLGEADALARLGRGASALRQLLEADRLLAQGATLDRATTCQLFDALTRSVSERRVDGAVEPEAASLVEETAVALRADRYVACQG